MKSIESEADDCRSFFSFRRLLVLDAEAMIGSAFFALPFLRLPTLPAANSRQNHMQLNIVCSEVTNIHIIVVAIHCTEADIILY